MRNFLFAGAFGLALFVTSMAAAGSPAVEGYRDAEALGQAARSLAKSKYADYRVLAQTLDGREVGLLAIGSGKVDAKPAILVVGGVNPARPVDAEVTLRMASRLVEAAESEAKIRRLLDRVTFYVIAQAAPDGTDAFFAKPT